MMRLPLIFSLAFGLFLSLPVMGQEGESGRVPSSPTQSSSTGLPLPRFASLSAGEVNLRTGPGTRYPIDWVYVRPGLPVEITGEFDIWRRIRDWEGSEGWVHKTALTGKRTAIIGAEKKVLTASDKAGSAVLATVEPNAVGLLLSCQIEWCKVKFKDIKGYMPKTDFWGAYSQEVFN